MEHRQEAGFTPDDWVAHVSPRAEDRRELAESQAASGDVAAAQASLRSALVREVYLARLSGEATTEEVQVVAALLPAWTGSSSHELLATARASLRVGTHRWDLRAVALMGADPEGADIAMMKAALRRQAARQHRQSKREGQQELARDAIADALALELSACVLRGEVEAEVADVASRLIPTWVATETLPAVLAVARAIASQALS
jgi:hypothetical protein